MNRKEFTPQPEDTESGQRRLPRSAVLQAFRRRPLPSSGDGSQRERSRHVGCHDARGDSRRVVLNFRGNPSLRTG
jgi:hypothetical protein